MAAIVRSVCRGKLGAARPTSFFIGSTATPCLLLNDAKFGGQKRYIKCGAQDLRKGAIFSEDGVYYEVESWAQQRQGRSATTYVMDVRPVLGGKSTIKRMGTNCSVTIHQLKNEEKLVMYADRENEALVVADTDFNEENIPLKYVSPALQSKLENSSGKPVLIRRDENGNIVEVKAARVTEAKLAAYGSDE